MFNLIAFLLQKSGLLGILLLMILENGVPLLPSELIMPIAGLQSAQGIYDPFLVIGCGTVGSVIGGALSYWVGRRLGISRLKQLALVSGRWLPVSGDDLSRGQRWFDRWGASAVCIGRTLPGVRGIVCFPAGLAHMQFGQFLLWSSIGAAAWCSFLVGAGYVIGDHLQTVSRWLNPVVDAFVALCLLAYLVQVAKYKHQTCSPD